MKKHLFISVVLFTVFHLLTLLKGDSGDMFCWYDWGKVIYTHGLGSVYQSSTDYMPLFHYFLSIYVFLQSGIRGVADNIEYFKIAPLIVHFIGGYFVLMLIQKDRHENYPIQKSLFYLLNVPILYNALVWGQMDIILSCFILVSYYFAVKEKITLSLLLLIAALNFKLQAIVFVPPLILMLLPLMIRNFSFAGLARWILFPLAFQALILLPFYLDGSLERVWEVVTGSFGKYPRLSMKAYNIWYLFFPDLTMQDPDDIRFAGLTCKNWGLILFCLFSFLALFPFFKTIYNSLRSRIYIALSLEKSLLIFALIPLLFFYFNTEMHERYSHSCIVFILIYGIRTNRPVLPFMATWCYFFNLEGALHAFHIDNYGTVIFHPVVISALWLLIIIGLFLNLYEKGPGFALTGKHLQPFITLKNRLYKRIEPLLNFFGKTAQWKKYLGLSLIVGAVLQALTPAAGHGWDTHCWIEWAKSMYNFGLKNVYSTWTEYLPLFQYFLKVYTLFQSSAEEAAANIQYFKIESLIFHLISGYFLLILIQKNNPIKNPVAKSLFYLLNVAVLYNSMIWGQVDIILTAFVLMSYYYAVQHKITLSLFFYVAAINFKIQAIIFIPPLGLMLLPLMIRDFSPVRLLKWIFIPLAFQVLILSPYIYTDDVLAIWDVIIESFGRYKSVSLNAFNFWHLVFPGLTSKKPDTEEFLSLAYKNWGLILFFVASCITLFPLFKSLFNSLRQRKCIELPLDKTLLIFALIPFLFFYFNTEMHERYSHPGLIFVIIYGIRKGRFTLIFTASMAYFFNLESVMFTIPFPNGNPVFFQPILISLFWLFTIVGLFLELYDVDPWLFFRKKNNGMIPATQ